ncbi:MAG: hypothetical protein KKE62_01375 [Proteobacteria bacterium]|nr:hypothetical protein [Pseudomonadota bacterium]MBU1541470.1 hypothetical protein [Pseudomonadota bacterium]MBU2431853.1 hypothetical protein [Pseudomonadota bacterium]MBU2480306.1 hypothetical protein [Pseudomonadota bacterium]
MKFIKFSIICCLVLSLFSCAPDSTGPASYVGVNYPEITQALAIEIADLIQQEMNIPTTVINLAKDDENILSDKVLTILKNRGYAISQTEGTVTTFTIDELSANKIYLTITLDKIRLSRIYTYEAQTGKILPGSPLNKGEV